MQKRSLSVALALLVLPLAPSGFGGFVPAAAADCVRLEGGFTANAWACVQLADDVQPALLMWTGVVRKPEVTSYQYGTHQLFGHALDGKSDGAPRLYALKSATVNLDPWVGKTVIIGGELVEGYPLENGPPLIDVRQIEADRPVKGN